MLRTIPNMFLNTVNNFENKPFLWNNTFGWKSKSFLEAKKEIYMMGAAILSQGLCRQEIGIISEGSSKWVISLLGILFADCTYVAFSSNPDPFDLSYRMSITDCKMVFVSAKHFDSLGIAIKKTKKKDLTIIFYDSDSSLINSFFYSYDIQKYCKSYYTYDDFLSYGAEYIQKTPTIIEDLTHLANEQSTAAILFTAGTVDKPKPVKLLHKNFYISTSDIAYIFQDLPKNSLVLAFTNPDIYFTLTVGIMSAIFEGNSIAFSDIGDGTLHYLQRLSKIIQNLQPTYMLTIPHIIHNFKTRIDEYIHSKFFLYRLLISFTLNCGFRYYRNGYKHRSLFKTLLFYIPYFLLRVVVFKRIHHFFGNKLRFSINCEGILEKDIQRFFRALGLPVYQTYGMTEATGLISANSPQFIKFGTCGLPSPSVACKIKADGGRNALPGETGEILIKSDALSQGYYNDACQSTYYDGWFASGDIGYIDTNGFLVVQGRKDFIQKTDKASFYPDIVENVLKSSIPLISRIIVINNGHTHSSALIVPDRYRFMRFIKSRGIFNAEIIYQHFTRLMKSVMKRKKYAAFASSGFFPSIFYIVNEQWSIANSLLNTSSKVKRKEVLLKYTSEITIMSDLKNKKKIDQMNIINIKSLIKLKK